MHRITSVLIAACALALAGCSKEGNNTAAGAPPVGSTESAQHQAAPAAQPAPTSPAPEAAASATSATAVAAGDASSIGQKVYGQICVACHGTGAAGAPKIGDKGDWGPRIAQGKTVLYTHALQGFNGKNGTMPPKGGSSLPDEDIRAAVDYLVSQAQ